LLLVKLKCENKNRKENRLKTNLAKTKYINRQLLVEKKIINDLFDYQGFDESIKQVYQYYDTVFSTWLKEYADCFGIENYCFFIKNNNKSNAFALRKKEYNIIGITNGYPILMNDKLSSKYFRDIALAGILNEPDISEAYCELINNNYFDFHKFILNCSLRFTFHHEFQHLLQMNFERNNSDEITLNEYLEMSKYDIKKHVWEFDADRISSHEVLKYVFSVYSKYSLKNEKKFICMLYISVASVLVTLNLFYFGIINQIESPYRIDKIPFYTEMYSHPHPLARCIYIMEYIFECIMNDFPTLEITAQKMLINTTGIMKLYFDVIVPENNIMNTFFDEMILHINEINEYNKRLYNYAIKDYAIKGILLKRNISFD